MINNNQMPPVQQQETYKIVGHNQNFVGGDYNIKLCGGMKDCKTCCCSIFCSCCVLGSNCQKLTNIEEDCYTYACCMACFSVFYSCIGYTFRKRFRKKYSMVPGQRDFMHWFLFPCCAVAQDFKEIEWRKREANNSGLPY